MTSSWQAFFLGAGISKGKRSSAAIIIHRTHVRGFRSFKAVSDWVCAVGWSYWKVKMRLIGVYMRHSWYSDAVVEATYSEINTLIDSARRLGIMCIVAGDWKAVTGNGIRGRMDQSLVVSVLWNVTTEDSYWWNGWLCSVCPFWILFSKNTQRRNGRIYLARTARNVRSIILLWTFQNDARQKTQELRKI